MKPVVASAVWRDLKEILDQIAPHNPEAAVRVVDAARRSFELIGNHPGIGRLRTFRIAGIRSWPISEYPTYLIFYLARKSEVRILAVLHGARDLDREIESRI